MIIRMWVSCRVLVLSYSRMFYQFRFGRHGDAQKNEGHAAQTLVIS